jgi:hypothetical protein
MGRDIEPRELKGGSFKNKLITNLHFFISCCCHLFPSVVIYQATDGCTGIKVYYFTGPFYRKWDFNIY